MNPRENVERILAGFSEGDASEVVQAAGELLDFFLDLERMLTTETERAAIRLGMVALGMEVDHVRIGHPGPSCCADCGSDACCLLTKGES